MFSTPQGLVLNDEETLTTKESKVEQKLKESEATIVEAEIILSLSTALT